MALTFRGGVHMHDYKNTRKMQIQRLLPPDTVSIPLLQHKGVACKALVAVGDTVDKGQLIGAYENGLGCPCHASVSGKVTEIAERIMENGMKTVSVVIENDREDRLSPSVMPYEKSINDTTPEEIIEIVKNAGISGMGGSEFPTYEKISTALGKAKYIIINCAESEPFITANHRLMLEDPDAVINGTKILLKALGLRSAMIAVEDNKLDAAAKLEEAAAGSEMINIKVVRSKYPQGDERQLIYALTGKELPLGKLPVDVGCVVFNAETTAAVYRAFALGMPLIEKIVTVDGDCVAEPKNLLVPIGTSYADLFDFCGGFTKEPMSIVNGGPMMGVAQWDIEAPVVKGTSAILAFSADFGKEFYQSDACIRCGRCVRVCPMRLMPSYLANFSQAGNLDSCEKFDVMSCVECGSCSYICPGRVPIVQYIRIAKSKINDKRRLAAVKAEEAKNEEKTEETGK